MTMAERLMEILNADKSQWEEMAHKFAEDVKGHPEEKNLLDCLEQTKYGRSFLSWGRNIFVPETLQDEGFWILPDGSGFLLMFAPKTGR